MANLIKTLKMIGLGLAASLLVMTNPAPADNVDVSSHPDYGYEYDRSGMETTGFNPSDLRNTGYDFNYEREWDFNLNPDELDRKPVNLEVEKDGKDVIETGLEVEKDGQDIIEIRDRGYRGGHRDWNLMPSVLDPANTPEAVPATEEVIETNLEVEKDGQDIIEIRRDRGYRDWDFNLMPTEPAGVNPSNGGLPAREADLNLEVDTGNVIDVNGRRHDRDHRGYRDNHGYRGWGHRGGDNNLVDPATDGSKSVETPKEGHIQMTNGELEGIRYPGMVPDYDPIEVPGYPEFPETPIES